MGLNQKMSLDTSNAKNTEFLTTEPVEPDWYVAYTQPKREHVAESNLAQQGFSVYCPRYKTFKKSATGSIPIFGPMFPRYLFFRPRSAKQSISAAKSSRGVATVLSFGTVPAVLKEQELQRIQACEMERNQADAAQASPFYAGLHVRLRHCGLSGLEGLVESVSAKRVTLLLELLGSQKKVQVAHHQVVLS